MLNHLLIPLAVGAPIFLLMLLAIKLKEEGRKKELWKRFGVLLFSSLGMFAVRTLSLAGGPTLGSFIMLFLASGICISLALLCFYRIKAWQDVWTALFIILLTLGHSLLAHIVFLKMTMASIPG